MTAAYHRQHAQDAMVHVWEKYRSRGFCTRRSSYSVDGIKAAAYCKRHAEGGMADVRATRRSFVPPGAATAACVPLTRDILDCLAVKAEASGEVAVARKRTGSELTGQKPIRTAAIDLPLRAGWLTQVEWIAAREFLIR